MPSSLSNTGQLPPPCGAELRPLLPRRASPPYQCLHLPECTTPDSSQGGHRHAARSSLAQNARKRPHRALPHRIRNQLCTKADMRALVHTRLRSVAAWRRPARPARPHSSRRSVASSAGQRCSPLAVLPLEGHHDHRADQASRDSSLRQWPSPLRGCRLIAPSLPRPAASTSCGCPPSRCRHVLALFRGLLL